MNREVSIDNVAALVSGSRIGVLSAAHTYPDVIETWVENVVRDRGPVPLVGPQELAETFSPDDLAVTVGMVGSVTAMLEIPPRGDEPLTVVRALERRLGARISAVAPLNAAGPNALIPVVAASLLDVPLLDVDGMGRVFPMIDQTTYLRNGIMPSPLSAVGPWGDVVVLDSPQQRVETMVRATASAAGGWLFAAMYPAPVAGLAAAGLPGQVSSRITSGTLALDDSGPLGTRLADQLGGRLVGRGQVTEISEHQESGLEGRRQPGTPMSILIRELEAGEREIRLEIRNETVLATRDGVVVASAPDTICLLDPLRRSTVDPLDLQLGDVMDVLVLPAEATWSTEEALRLVGPAVYGVPLRHRSRR